MKAIVTPAGRLWDGQVSAALCVDLDGTIRRSKSGAEFIAGPDDVELFPGVEETLWEWRERGHLICGVSNQGGVAFGIRTPDEVMNELEAMLALFGKQPFHIIKQCFHHPDGSQFPYNKRSLCRKPDIGMLALIEMEAFDAGYLIDWDASLFVGDRPEDEECARRAGLAFQWADEFFRRTE